MFTFILVYLFALSELASAAPRNKRASDCTTTISSINDASSAGDCTTVNIEGFTVPAGQGFELDLADETTVNLSESTNRHAPSLYNVLLDGNVLFGNVSWEGPLFTISTFQYQVSNANIN
jgi:polygalacturonase